MWTHVRKVYLPKVDWQFVLDLPCFLFPVRCDWIQTFISHRVKTFSSIYIQLSKQNPNMPPSNTFKLIDLVFLHWDKSQLLWFMQQRDPGLQLWQRGFGFDFCVSLSDHVIPAAQVSNLSPHNQKMLDQFNCAEAQKLGLLYIFVFERNAPVVTAIGFCHMLFISPCSFLSGRCYHISSFFWLLFIRMLLFSVLFWH